MRITLGQAKGMLRDNVCELFFSRRRPWLSTAPTRKIICTLNTDILLGVNGRLILNYRPPVHPLPYNAESMNLLPVWDILMQDWRMVSMDYCNLVNTIPVSEFWDFFEKKLRPMSTEEKMTYMGK